MWRREVEGLDAEEGGTEDEELGDEHVDTRVDHPHRGKEETEQSENDGEEEGKIGEEGAPSALWASPPRGRGAFRFGIRMGHRLECEG